MMDSYLVETIEKYLADLSSRKMVPGGGSAAALAAAIGVGLNLMTINYSRLSDDPDPSAGGFMEVASMQMESLKKLSSLVDDDCKVFKDLMETLSTGSDAEQQYIAAAEAPMKVCRECWEALKIARDIIEKSNKNLLTDIICAGHLLNAAFHSAKINVEVNLKHIKDDSVVRGMQDELISLGKNMDNILLEILDKIGKITK